MHVIGLGRNLKRRHKHNRRHRSGLPFGLFSRLGSGLNGMLADQQGRAGNAGIWASMVVALVGVLIGALATYVGERGAAAQAARTVMLATASQAQTQEEIAFLEREKNRQDVVDRCAP